MGRVRFLRLFVTHFGTQQNQLLNKTAIFVDILYILMVTGCRIEGDILGSGFSALGSETFPRSTFKQPREAILSATI